MSEHKEHSIGLIGEGCIYQQVKRLLEETYQVIPFTVESASQSSFTSPLVVYCCDIWSPRTLREINRSCLQAGVALLPIYTQFDEGVIGPCVIPQRQGCTSCAELRKTEAFPSEADHILLHEHISQERPSAVSQPWLSSFSLQTLAVLARKEITAYLRNPDQLRTVRALLSISLVTLECYRHTFLPGPSCPDCAQPISDEAELAAITLQSQPKADVFTYRIREPVAEAEQIFATYVDSRTGIVSSLITEQTNFLPTASSRLSTHGEAPTGTGCTLSTNQSQVVSVLEVIERYAGLRPRSKRTAIRASYHQLLQDGRQALDPTTLGLHTSEQYEQQQHSHSGRQFVPYHHDLVCHWVWGYSFQKQAPLLIPEHCAYYGVPITAENPAFVFDVSNGCALGNCMEEALFHGMLEVIERDAFLLMWYARLQTSRFDLRSLADPTTRFLLEHLEYHSGYAIYAFNLTLDHAIPCVCLLAVDEQAREDKPRAFIAAGSHPHPEQALFKALRECAMFLAFPRHLNRERVLEMLMDANLVQQMEHHPLVYYLPEAFERLHFLYHTPRQQTFQEAFSDFYQNPPERLDLREDLEALLDYYLKRGTDVIAVEQTAPEHLPCGLRCVKVLMPGMLPMTFGQNHRRITGFERLHQLPFTLGYQDHPLETAEINPYPHPFF